MKFPVDIVFRHIPRSYRIERFARRQAEKLERHCGRILHCRIVVDVPHRQHQNGNLYRVRIALCLPGTELVAGNDPGKGPAFADLFEAVSDAFTAVRNQIAHDRGHCRSKPSRTASQHGQSIGELGQPV